MASAVPARWGSSLCQHWGGGGGGGCVAGSNCCAHVKRERLADRDRLLDRDAVRAVEMQGLLGQLQVRGAFAVVAQLRRHRRPRLLGGERVLGRAARADGAVGVELLEHLARRQRAVVSTEHGNVAPVRHALARPVLPDVDAVKRFRWVDDLGPTAMRAHVCHREGLAAHFDYPADELPVPVHRVGRLVALGCCFGD